MVCMDGVTTTPRQRQDRAGQYRSIFLSQFATPDIFTIEVAQLDSENCRLQFVQPAVHTWLFAHIPLPPAVLAELSHAACDGWVVCHYRACVTQSSKVLGGIEAECRRMAPGASFAAAQRCAVRLRTVFDNVQPVSVGEIH